MLIEIPDPDVILSVIISFLVGLGGLFAYYKLRPIIKINENGDVAQAERLEYYERQLIDMKIRLDSLELEGTGEKSGESNQELKQFLEKLVKSDVKEKPNEPKETEVLIEEPQNRPITPVMDSTNATDYVLHLITSKPMTSRDIQITLKRSREHTSRLMKKLFDDGYVNRNTESKPYTYSITEKGKEKISGLEPNLTIT